MRAWLLLAGAIVSEVTASLSLQAAVDRPAFYVIVVLGYSASFAFLALVLRRGMPLGVAYGIWAALGVALTAVAATVLFDEPMNPLKGVGIGLVILGVLAVEMGSPKQQAEDRDAIPARTGVGA